MSITTYLTHHCSSIGSAAHRWLVIALCLPGTLLPLASHAAGESDESPELADMSIEQLWEIELPTVYAASKRTETTLAAPSSVSIITSDEIRKLGYRHLTDILDSVRGLYSSYDRNYHHTGIRGFNRPGDYNTRILMLIDGQRLNDAVYNAVGTGTDNVLDIDLIERIEVIRGSGSALYGSNAFFGVINIITKDAAAYDGVELAARGGSPESYRGRATYGNVFENGLSAVMSGTYYWNSGDGTLFYSEFDDPTTNDGIVEDRDSDRFGSAFVDLTLGDFALQGAYSRREKVVPTAPYETEFDTSKTRTIDETAYLNLVFERPILEDGRIEARGYYQHYYFKGDYFYDYADPGDPADLVVNRDRADGDLLGFELRGSKPVFTRHLLSLGGEVRHNVRQDQRNFDVDPHFVYLDDERTATEGGVYGQANIELHPKVKLDLGVRYDHFESFGDTTNPRVALIYSPTEHSAVKAIYGTAFRAPSAYELYYHDGEETTKANHDLLREKISSYELIGEHFFNSRLYGTVASYYYQIEDLIGQVVDPDDDLAVFENVDKVRAAGISTELKYQTTAGLLAKASYAFQRAWNTDTDKTLSSSPQHLVKLSLILPVFSDMVFTGVDMQYTSREKTLAGKHSDGFFLTNLTVYSDQIYENFDVSFTVFNLFDAEYDFPGSTEHAQDVIRQDGRTFELRVGYKF